MRYIANDSGYLLEVSFGALITCGGMDCVAYTGSVPEGYDSLEDWYSQEYEKLYRWKVVDGNLALDSSAAAPEEMPRADYVVDQGVTGGWTWRKWASGISECWGIYDVSNVPCTTAAGALYRTDTIDPAMFFPDGLFLPFENTKQDDDRMTCQMTFTSSSGTPAFIWCNGFVHPGEGASRFMLMRHASATISGRMQYSYKGRWR